MKWEPVTELLREIYEGDVSLMNGWPLEWWGQEPFMSCASGLHDSICLRVSAWPAASMKTGKTTVRLPRAPRSKRPAFRGLTEAIERL